MRGKRAKQIRSTAKDLAAVSNLPWKRYVTVKRPCVRLNKEGKPVKVHKHIRQLHQCGRKIYQEMKHAYTVLGY